MAALVARSGLQLPPADNAGPSAVRELQDRFIENVVADRDKPGRLEAEWHSIAGDIGLYLGDIIIARSPNLQWSMYTTSRQSSSYQEAVIMANCRSRRPFPRGEPAVAGVVGAPRVLGCSRRWTDFPYGGWIRARIG